MRDVFYAIIVFFILLVVLVTLTQTNYKADEERLLQDYPGWIVVDKKNNWIDGKQIKVVNPTDKRTGIDDLKNYDDFRCYAIIFDKYEVGDTLK